MCIKSAPYLQLKSVFFYALVLMFLTKFVLLEGSNLLDFFLNFDSKLAPNKMQICKK